MRKRAIRPSLKPLPRWTPLRPRNRERREALFRKQYGSRERVLAIQRRPCCIPGCHERAENAHTKSRAAGATWRDVWDVCKNHHAEQHRIGIHTFATRYGVDPWAVAARLAGEVPV